VRITVDRHKPTPSHHPPLRRAPSSRDSFLRLSSGVFSSVALSLSTFTFLPPFPQPSPIPTNLSRKSRFMQRRALGETLLHLFIYELSLVRRLTQRS